MAVTTDHDAKRIADANASGKQPVAFVHGLWLLPSSWDNWQEMFTAAGYVTLALAWPDDPETVAQAKADPTVFAHKSIGDIADHCQEMLGQLPMPRTTGRSATRA